MLSLWHANIHRVSDPNKGFKKRGLAEFGILRFVNANLTVICTSNWFFLNWSKIHNFQATKKVQIWKLGRLNFQSNGLVKNGGSHSPHPRCPGLRLDHWSYFQEPVLGTWLEGHRQTGEIHKEDSTNMKKLKTNLVSRHEDVQVNSNPSYQ